MRKLDQAVPWSWIVSVCVAPGRPEGGKLSSQISPDFLMLLWEHPVRGTCVHREEGQHIKVKSNSNRQPVSACSLTA